MTDLIFAVYSFGWVPVWAWWVVAWSFCSVITALGFGRVLRDRDTQIPQEVVRQSPTECDRATFEEAQ